MKQWIVKYKKYWLIGLGAVLLIYLSVTVYYAVRQQKAVICHDLQVEVIDSIELGFVTPEAVKNMLRENKFAYFSKTIEQINVDSLEKFLLSKSLIARADVTMNADGVLNIKILQRHPIVRIITSNQQDFYIDNNGYIFQWYKDYTANVLTVTGDFDINLPKNYRGSIDSVNLSQGGSEQWLNGLFTLAKVLNDSEYWNQQFTQVYVRSITDIELIPRVGKYIVKMGDLERLEYKLYKLQIFYQKGIQLKGWNYYKAINIAFGDQVIGEK